MQKEGNQPDSELQVLFIAHDFPPCADVGARRAIGFCRYLPEYRVQPVVLTVQGHLYERRDEDLAIPSGIRIYRTTVITNPLDWYGRWKVRGAPARNSSPALVTEPSSAENRTFLRKHLLALLKTPDDYWGWYLPAVRAATRLFREKPFVAVLSTGPPWTSHLIARHIKEKHALPWLADFRDPWASFHVDNQLPAWRRRVDRWMEEKCLNSADLIVCNTERLRQGFAHWHPNIPESKWVTLTNGYDDPIVPPKITPKGSCTLLMHVGHLYGDRRIDTFCKAIAELLKSRRVDAGSFKIVFIGYAVSSIMASSRQWAAPLIQNGSLEFQPRVGWQRAQEILSGADVLLVFQGGHSLQVPAKFYEYLRTGKPIFAVTEPGALTDLLESTQSGIWAHADDPIGIAAKFLEALTLPTRSHEEVQQRYDAQFHYRFLSGRLAEWIRKLTVGESSSG